MKPHAGLARLIIRQGFYTGAGLNVFVTVSLHRKSEASSSAVDLGIPCNILQILPQVIATRYKVGPKKLMALIVRRRNVSDIVVLDLVGRLWVLDLPLGDLVNGILIEGRHNFVLNLAGVDYIDSSGLGQLISIWALIRSRGGHMTILNPSKRVQRLFEITRLNAVFEICGGELDAVQKARKVSA